MKVKNSECPVPGISAGFAQTSADMCLLLSFCFKDVQSNLLSKAGNVGLGHVFSKCPGCIKQICGASHMILKNNIYS